MWTEIVQGTSEQFPLENLIHDMGWHYGDKNPLVFKTIQVPEAGRRKQQYAWEFIHSPIICSSVQPHILWHITSLSHQFNHVRSQPTQIDTMCSVVRCAVKYTWSLPLGNSLLQEWWVSNRHAILPSTLNQADMCFFPKGSICSLSILQSRAIGQLLLIVGVARQNRIDFYT